VDLRKGKRELNQKPLNTLERFLFILAHQTGSNLTPRVFEARAKSSVFG